MIGAFFDIDGTLYRNSLLIENFKKLIKYEVVDEMVWLEKVKKPFHAWSIRKGDYEHYLLDVAETFRESLIGIDKNVIDFLANQVVSQSWDKTYVFTRNRIAWHKSQGHKTFFISGSPDFLVSKMAKQYEVEEYRASHYILDDEGKFNGEVLPMWDSPHKKEAILSYSNEFDIDLSESYAYGDTSGDLTMLEMVGHPVAINPNRNLFQIIQEDDELRKKAMIVVERKDMIYHIEPDKINVFPE